MGHAKGREKNIFQLEEAAERPRGLCDYSAARGQSNVGLGQTEEPGHSAPTKPFKGIYIYIYAQSQLQHVESLLVVESFTVAGGI